VLNKRITVLILWWRRKSVSAIFGNLHRLEMAQIDHTPRLRQFEFRVGWRHEDLELQRMWVKASKGSWYRPNWLHGVRPR